MCISPWSNLSDRLYDSYFKELFCGRFSDFFVFLFVWSKRRHSVCPRTLWGSNPWSVIDYQWSLLNQKSSAGKRKNKPLIMFVLLRFSSFVYLFFGCWGSGGNAELCFQNPSCSSVRWRDVLAVISHCNVVVPLLLFWEKSNRHTGELPAFSLLGDSGLWSKAPNKGNPIRNNPSDWSGHNASHRENHHRFTTMLRRRERSGKAWPRPPPPLPVKVSKALNPQTDRLSSWRTFCNLLLLKFSSSQI